MEPVLDSSGQPVTGIRYTEDGCGVTIKNRLWRGNYITDFEGAGQRLEKLSSEFKNRSDDVMILAYLKCGTHWMHDICHFLLTRQTQSRPDIKENFMLENVELETIDSLPSPRILNCHAKWSLLPPSITSAKRVVYVVRNPKDCAVSMYNHCTTINDYEYSGTFEGFLSLFEKGQLDAGSWFTHTRESLDFVAKAPSNVLMVQYELLKKQPRQEIKRIADFLLEGEAVEDELLDSIVQRVSFSSMAADRHKDFQEIFNEKSKTGFYRKGEVGDWKNWFSEEKSARIDALTAEALKGLEEHYQPIYE